MAIEAGRGHGNRNETVTPWARRKPEGAPAHDMMFWRSVLAGEFQVDGAGWLDGIQHVRWTRVDHAQPLTATESVVLALVLFGATNDRAAQELKVDATTVASHLKNLRGKLNANRAELLSLGPIVGRLRGGQPTPLNEVAVPGEVVMFGQRLDPISLTQSELDVATKLASGRTNREIARSRGTSPRTVGDQLEKLYRKLRVSSRRQLTLLLYGVAPQCFDRAEAMRLLRYRPCD